VRRNRDIWLLSILLIVLIVLSIWSVSVGDVSIPFNELFTILKGDLSANESWSYIVEGRLNRTTIALLSGGALSVTGLILQVFFKNPLAGPGVLGISSGVTLGVAIVVLGGFSMLGLGSILSLVCSGLLGALVILSILMVVSKFIKHSITLLIVGLMLSYFSSALVSALYHWADLEQSRQFIIWGLGSFDGISSQNISWILPVVLFSIGSLTFLIRPLNGFALGEDYAKSVGIYIKTTKALLILISSLLTAVVTVYCGPVAFIGIAVPQIVRGVTQSKSHQIILPLAVVFGALFALLADLGIRLTGNVLPLNTVTSLIGSPIIVWTIIRMNKRS